MKRLAVMASARASYKKHAEKRRIEKVRKYGITEAQYFAMLAVQNGRCAICLRKERKIVNGRRVRLAVDHDHSTGAVRGLLCSDCNLSIGKFMHSPEVLERAAKYLRRTNAMRNVS